jgi:hypothetical protein
MLRGSTTGASQATPAPAGRRPLATVLQRRAGRPEPFRPFPKTFAGRPAPFAARPGAFAARPETFRERPERFRPLPPPVSHAAKPFGHPAKPFGPGAKVFGHPAKPPGHPAKRFGEDRKPAERPAGAIDPVIRVLHLYIFRLRRPATGKAPATAPMRFPTTKNAPPENHGSHG